MKLLVVLIASFALASCQTVLQVARALGANRFVDQIEDAGIVYGDDVTLFAPLDFTYAADIPDFVESDWPNILNYHAVEGQTLECNAMTNYSLVETKQGAPIRFTHYTASDGDELLTAGGHQIIFCNIHASDGVVHVVAGLIQTYPTGTIMDWLESDSDYSIYTEGLKNHGLDADLRNPDIMSTILVANNHGMDHHENPPANELLYHQVDGLLYSSYIRNNDEFKTREGSSGKMTVVVGPDGIPEYFVDGEEFLRGNIHCTNGVIHVIDHFLHLH